VTQTRERILEAVRAGLGAAGLGSRPLQPQTIAAEATALLTEPDLIRPQLGSKDLVEVFAEHFVSQKLGGTLETIPDLEALPDAVRRYVAAQGLPPAIALQPAAELLGLNWDGIETRRTMAKDEAVGVGFARWAIAETGSLVFHSGPDTPILFNFLPLHHIVAVRANTILPHLEDYAEAAARTSAPRNVGLVTGASGTTDIEGSYVRGAHGPRFLHVIIITDRPA
jgi:L-lactate dehydrogenase complex protein LldG